MSDKTSEKLLVELVLETKRLLDSRVKQVEYLEKMVTRYKEALEKICEVRDMYDGDHLELVQRIAKTAFEAKAAEEKA